MLKRILSIFWAFILLAVAGVSAAQSECSALVQQALALTDQNCGATGRNQACYGYLRVEAQPRPSVDGFTFAVGDTADLASIATLHTTALNPTNGEWGIALLRLQANLPDALPGQNVTFLLLGDVTIDDDGASQTSPMQAIRLRTGVAGTSCESAPENSLLIQTPHGAGRVELTINKVQVSLGSTVVVQATAGGNMTISTLEGSAQITINGQTEEALPGAQLQIPLDGSLQPVGSPAPSTPYLLESVAALPIGLLERTIAIPPPAAIVENAVETVQETVDSVGDAGEVVDQALDEVGDGVHAAADAANQAVGQTVDAVQETVSGVIDAVNGDSEDEDCLLGLLCNRHH